MLLDLVEDAALGVVQLAVATRGAPRAERFDRRRSWSS